MVDALRMMLRFPLLPLLLRFAVLCGGGSMVPGATPPGPFVDRVEELEDLTIADWIAPPPDLKETNGVYLFRRTFELAEVPGSWPVLITADPRYKLHVNGRFVDFGPVPGDPFNWSYAEVDLAPWLIAGRNALAVEVWDPGSLAPTRQYSIQTGLLLQSAPGASPALRTDGTWRVKRSAGWAPLSMDDATVGGGYIAGATDQWTAAAHPWGWTEAEFDDSTWSAVRVVGKASHGGLDTWLGTSWMLRPRAIPPLETALRSAGEVRVTELDGASSSEGRGAGWPLEVPARGRARVLLDAGTIVMGFPQLTVSGGAGGRVQLRYQESLFQPNGGKGNRNAVAGKVMKGYFDRFFPDGPRRVFEPEWLRVYRYLELSVEAGDEPVRIEAPELRQVRYPFHRYGAFTSSDPALEAILEASWRTVELCALETYMDCPYYEQVQYVGDTRIQALISLYMTGDDRLMRQAIEQFHRSRLPMGLTRSAFPVRGGGTPQVIPPFSLVYISMVRDYYWHRPETDFIGDLLPGIRFTLDWFLGRLDEDGLLGPLPFWNHTDGGARGFHHGSPPGASTGGSIQLTLLLAAALDDAAELAAAFGREGEAEDYRERAAALKEAVHRHGYDARRGLYAETPAKGVFSQHTNAYAILTGTVPAAERAALAERLVTDESLIQGSLYFQFYIFEALAAAGRGELIVGELDRWREMLAVGLTTFPEHGVESRSDAHAWAAHPLYHLLASVAGVRPAAPGFQRVRIVPVPGSLQQLRAVVAHPRGRIELDWHAVATPDGRPAGYTVVLPDGVSGVLHWQGREHLLQPGDNQVPLNSHEN